MYYEIYVDSLLIVNFTMNFLLLLLVNTSSYRTATRLRLVLGAAVGAVMYFLPFLADGAVWLKTAIGAVAGILLMLFTAFRIKSIKSFFRILEKLVIFSFLMGGSMVLAGRYITGTFGIILIGLLMYFIIDRIMNRNMRGASLCKVSLFCSDGKVKVTALIDSGNSLVEPISGKPVSVIEKNVFHGLWKAEPQGYRVIPYHSIGKKKGMLKGYLLPEIEIETGGVIKTCKDVYVAVSDECISGDSISMPELEKGVQSNVRMIINPALLKK